MRGIAGALLGAATLSIASAGCEGPSTSGPPVRAWVDRFAARPSSSSAAAAASVDAGAAPNGNAVSPWGDVQTQLVPPPPISGGTLIALRDGRTAVAADPDRDAIHVIDLPDRTARSVPLDPGDEPGRLVEDGAGRVHVALRG